MNYAVCVVEDERVSRTMTLEMLKKMGLNKIVASTNGQIALEKLKTQKADLIISDWHMPVMNGLEFYKAVKERRNIKRHTLSDGDCGRFKRKSDRSAEIRNPRLHRQTIVKEQF